MPIGHNSHNKMGCNLYGITFPQMQKKRSEFASNTYTENKHIQRKRARNASNAAFPSAFPSVSVSLFLRIQCIHRTNTRAWTIHAYNTHWDASNLLDHASVDRIRICRTSRWYMRCTDQSYAVTNTSMPGKKRALARSNGRIHVGCARDREERSIFFRCDQQNIVWWKLWSLIPILYT